jgi:hypothetical protein
MLTETGYVRTWHTVIDEESKTITGYWGGSEDFSDGGVGDDHLACSLCSETKPVPDGWTLNYE